MADAFVNGLQGDEPYLVATAALKHFVAHSGPEYARDMVDARVNPHDLFATYLRAFHDVIETAHPAMVMSSYNRLNGIPMSENMPLLNGVLRKNWGFRGLVVSDCNAILYTWRDVHAFPNAEAAAATALKDGVDMSCWNDFFPLTAAYADGLVSMSDIDRALKRVLTVRFELGMFDSAARVPYSTLGTHDIDTASDRALALAAAHESVVLLKNAAQTLPLACARTREIAVIGPNGDSLDVLNGNYHGTASSYVTIAKGIERIAQACHISAVTVMGTALDSKSQTGFAPAVAAARNADVTIAVLGYSPVLENEEGNGGDRTSLRLPGNQQQLLEALWTTGKPIVLVLTGGSAVAVPWAQAHVPAIIMSWYSGEEGGDAVADVLFGRYNPGGKLPLTFYRSLADVPPMSDYSMKGRTYRYFMGKPLYPFGFGLSYTTFSFGRPVVRQSRRTMCKIFVTVTNTGARAGDDVIELYVRKPLSVWNPLPSVEDLIGFRRVTLFSKQSAAIALSIKKSDVAEFSSQGDPFGPAGLYHVALAEHAPFGRAYHSSPHLRWSVVRITDKGDLKCR